MPDIAGHGTEESSVSHLEGCRRVLVDGMAKRGIEVTVSTAPVLTVTPYDPSPITCPHGTTFWMQPTNEQIIRWREDGVK